MCSRLVKITLMFCLLVYIPFRSMAWGMQGHRIVGEIAYSYLTPKAKAVIQNILGTESLAMASNWADFIKSDSNYNYLSQWHYTNFEDGLNYTAFKNVLQHDTIADAYTKLYFIIKQLKNKNLPHDKKVMYLRLLVHIVGDIHQPLHMGRKEDQGGNAIKVVWFSEQTNLHSVWDDKLVDFQKLSYTEYTAAINHTTAAQRQQWQSSPISQWLFESYQTSRKIYDEIKEPDQKLGFRYNFDHIQTVNQQLLKAGVRLAGLLNKIFA